MADSRPPPADEARHEGAAARERLVAAFDPGRNVGFALVDVRGQALRLAVLRREEVATVALPSEAVVVVGAGTGRRDVLAALRQRGLEPRLVDERGTSLEGLTLWRRHAPARGLTRLLPAALRTPARPIDDHAAWAIALRYLAQRRADPEQGAG